MVPEVFSSDISLKLVFSSYSTSPFHLPKWQQTASKLFTNLVCHGGRLVVSMPLTYHDKEVFGPATTILIGCHSYYLVHSKKELNEE